MSRVAPQTVTNLIAWLAVRAGANIGPARRGSPTLAVAIPAAVVLGQTVEPNRAGQLVPVPEEALEPELGRSLTAHWALWAAVVLIVLVLFAGYVRRRWKAARRPARIASLASGRHDSRK